MNGIVPQDGISALQQNPQRIDISFLSRFPASQEFQVQNRATIRQPDSTVGLSDERTPEEIIIFKAKSGASDYRGANG